MKNEPRICKNCKYFSDGLKPFCKYWISEIGALVKTYGCEKWEKST